MSSLPGVQPIAMPLFVENTTSAAATEIQNDLTRKPNLTKNTDRELAGVDNKRTRAVPTLPVITLPLVTIPQLQWKYPTKSTTSITTTTTKTSITTTTSTTTTTTTFVGDPELHLEVVTSDLAGIKGS